MSLKISIFCLLLLLLAYFGLVLGVSAEEKGMEAPLNIDEIDGKTLSIDFHEFNPQAKKEDWKFITVLGSKGMSVGSLQRFKSKCTAVCDSQVCHTIGVYQLTKTMDQLGEFRAALQGKEDLRTYKDLKPIEVKRKHPAKFWVSKKDFQASIIQDYWWDHLNFRTQPTPKEAHNNYSYKWTAKQKLVYLEERSWGETKRGYHGLPINFKACKEEKFAGLTVLECEAGQKYHPTTVSLVYSGKKLLFAQKSAFQKVGMFRYAGRPHYILTWGNSVHILYKDPRGWYLLERYVEHPTATSC